MRILAIGKVDDKTGGDRPREHCTCNVYLRIPSIVVWGEISWFIIPCLFHYYCHHCQKLMADHTSILSTHHPEVHWQRIPCSHELFILNVIDSQYGFIGRYFFAFLLLFFHYCTRKLFYTILIPYLDSKQKNMVLRLFIYFCDLPTNRKILVMLCCYSNF